MTKNEKGMYIAATIAIIAAIISILAFSIEAAKAEQYASPSNFSMTSPTTGDIHYTWTNPEWKKIRSKCSQIIVTYRIASPFDEMVRKHPTGECTIGNHEWDEPNLPSGEYESRLSTGFDGEWEATTGFSGPALKEVPSVIAGPIKVS